MNILTDIKNHIHAYNIYLDEKWFYNQKPLIWLANCHPFDRDYYTELLKKAGYVTVTVYGRLKNIENVNGYEKNYIEEKSKQEEGEEY